MDECGLVIRAALKRKQPIKDDVEVAVDLYTCRKQDLDNILKPTLDLLQRAGVIEDDVQVTSMVLNKIKVKHIKDEGLEVEVL